jgi:hypothetical protein
MLGAHKPCKRQKAKPKRQGRNAQGRNGAQGILRNHHNPNLRGRGSLADGLRITATN